MHGNELRLFRANASTLFVILISRIWYSSSTFNLQLTSLAMTRFWSSIRHRGRVLASMLILIIEFKTKHLVLGFPRPSIETITLPRQVDALRIMPQHRVYYSRFFLVYFIASSNKLCGWLYDLKPRFNKLIESCFGYSTILTWSNFFPCKNIVFKLNIPKKS